MDTFVLTGSTGAFGKFLALELLKHSEIKLILLVRGSSNEEAKARAENVIGMGNYHVYAADLAKDYFGLDKEAFEALAKEASYILHSAASTRFNLPLSESRLHNVENTKKIINFAKSCPNLKRFGYVSTAFVSGKRAGTILEDEFEHSAGFSNSYQESKYEAETLIRKEVGSLPVVVFRPPFIVSPSDIDANDKKAGKDFLTVLIQLIASGKLTYVPGTSESRMDLVTAEDAARAICTLMLKERLEHLSYHITNADRAVTISELKSEIEAKFNKKISMEYCGDVDNLKQKIVDDPILQAIYERGGSFLYEPAYSKIFDNKNMLSELGMKELGISPSQILRDHFAKNTWNISE
jgi:thioester reductase-like protein